MASYEAIINLVVQGEAALNRIQKKIDNLYKTVGDLETKKKFQGSQAAASFVRQQAEELERVVSVSKQQIKEQERSIVKQSKLNAAVDLYERRQRQLSRTSVANQKQFAAQIKDIEDGFKFFKDRKNASGVQAIATELGRIIEYDNELNRISDRRTANQRKLYSFSKEIAKYESFGLKTDRARKTLSNFEGVAGSNQLKQAQQYESALKNQLRLLKDQFIEQQRVARIAPSSPVLGGVNFPGSPKALTAQRKAEEIALRQSQRGFPSSPILGTPTMLGSPRAIAAQERTRVAAEKALRAQERAAKIAENAANKEAEKILRESQKGFPSSPIMGAATMAGSPKWIAAQERNRAASERRAATQQRAEQRAARIQQQAAIAAERAADKALKEAQKGFPSSPILGSATIAGSPRWKSAQESARQKLESAARATERAADRALKEAQKGFPSSPILGTATMAGSPKWKAAQERMARMAGGGGGAAGSGLEQALASLQEARGARQAFLGDTSPAQAIDQIVREFNKGASGGGAGQVAENVVDTYASGIKAGIPAVAQAMMNLGKAGIDAIKKALGMASPSRVMLAIAKNQIDTYVDFLRAALPAVEAVAKSLGEAGAPEVSGSKSFIVPESAIRRPITERARTRPLSAQDLERNSVIAEYAASQITGPMGQFENVKRKIEDFIDKTRTIVDLDKLFGGKENERFAMATRGVSAGPEFDKTRAALADFYQIPAELTPDLERGAKAANEAGVSADELARYVSGLAAGIEQIGTLLQSAAKLPTPSVATPATVVDNEFTRAQEAAARADAAAAEAARKKAEAQKPFEASIQKAAELDAEAKRKADAAVSSVVQAQIEADARAGAEAISRSILDPIKSAAPEGERQVRSAIENLFDRVTGALGFGGGSGGRPPVPPTGGGGPARDPEEFNRRLSQAVDEGAGAVLGLRELRDPTKATTLELEALSNVLKEFRKILDPTTEGFDRLEKQLRETAANLDRQVERRAPEAGFLTRQFGPRTARGLSEGLIGGAFPLLFGQGIGAAVGGGAGGFAGGFAGGGLGFGLSLVGTALGTAFDTAVQSATELGAALQKPVENFDKLTEKSFFSSKALENTIKKTIEYGDTATASALIQEESIKKLGVNGVQNLKILGTESDRLNRAFAELGQQMQAVAAGPLSAVTGFFANIFGQAAAAGRVRILRSNLNEQQAGQFNQEILGRLQQRGIQRGFFAPSAPTEAEIGMLQQQGALQDIVDKWQAIQIKGQIKIDPKQRIESEINALQKQLEAIDIGRSLKDQVRSTAKEQQDLDKQRFDLVRSYEDSIAGLRRQVEDEIRSKRFATLEKENQLLDAQGQIRIKQLQIENQAAIAKAGVGERPEIEQAAKEVAQIVAQFSEQQLSAEEEAARIKRDAALEAQKIDSDAAQLKVNIEKEVSRLNIETARRVAEINDQVRRRNEEVDTRRFTIERDIAALKLRLFQDELALATKNAALPLEARQQAFDLYEAVAKERSDVEKLKAPAPLRGVGAVGGGGVSTAGLDKAASDYRAAVENYVAAQLRLNELDVAKNAQEFSLGILSLANKTDAALTAIQTREADAEIERLRYIELINAGLTDTVAQKIIELEMTKQVSLAVYDTAIAQLENKIQAGEVTAQVGAQNRAYLEQIKILKERKDAIEGKFGAFDTGTGKGTGAIGGAMQSEPGKRIQDFIAQAKAELNDLEAVAVRVSQGIGDAVGSSLANGITRLVEGTATAKEIFSGFLKEVGDILIKEGTRMIGMYIAIGVAKMFAGLFSGAAGASKPALPGSMGQATNTGLNTGAGNISDMLSGLAADGAYFANGVAAFAKGGMFTNSVVSSPTLFKFADGGVQRTGLMGEAGPEAIMPLRRSASGRLGVEASGLREAMNSGAGGGMGTPSLNMTFETTNIGGVEYVSRDQLEAAMAATRRDAARDGAKRGMSMTLDKLQQSPGTRSRVGLR